MVTDVTTSGDTTIIALPGPMPTHTHQAKRNQKKNEIAPHWQAEACHAGSATAD